MKEVNISSLIKISHDSEHDHYEEWIKGRIEAALKDVMADFIKSGAGQSPINGFAIVVRTDKDDS